MVVERRIIEQAGFLNSLMELELSEHFREVFEYFKVPLSRTPDIFPRMGATDVRRLEMSVPGTDDPTIDVWFSHTDSVVQLLEVNVRDGRPHAAVGY